MSTTEDILTTPIQPQSLPSPINQAIDAALAQGSRAIRTRTHPQEWKLVSLRDCPTPAEIRECDTPQRAADYWGLHVQANPYFNPDVEFFVVILLNTRLRIKGHVIVGMGNQ
ncbi:MAG: hypothetical protein KIT22_10960 [Verrucomicrobiae bacterium]|nr:hypothetical protein [Verrucomicrobiae bacterium]